MNEQQFDEFDELIEGTGYWYDSAAQVFKPLDFEIDEELSLDSFLEILAGMELEVSRERLQEYMGRVSEGWFRGS